jgi:hypothetical protein
MEELDEIFIRNEINKILNEQTFGVTFGDIVPPSADQFYDTFIGPFVDVFKVAQVAVKDTADATLLTIQSALTFDGAKQKALQQKYRTNRDRYKGEMSKAMETTNKAMSSPDAQLLMFMMNPGVYMGAGMAKEAANTATPVTEFIGDSLGGIGTAMGLGSGFKAEKGEKGPLRGILDDMKVLFFGEGLDEIDELELFLLEGDEEKEVDDDEVQQMVDDWLEESGANKKIEGYAQDIIKQKKSEVEDIKKQRMDLIEALNAVTKVKTFEELATLIPQVAQGGIDLKDQASAAEKVAQEQKDILKAGDEEAKKMIEDLKKTPDGKALADASKPEDWFPLVDQGILAATFSGVVTKAKEQSIGELLGFVAEMTREELAELAKTGPLGKQYADLITGLENDLLSI